MVKKIILATLLLTIADFLLTLTLNLFLGNPGPVIAVIAVIKALYIPLSFGSISFIVARFFGLGITKASLAITSLIVYALFPAIVYFLKSNDKSLAQVFIDLNTQPNLFASIGAPFIIAAIITIAGFSAVAGVITSDE